jgi:hypothetical protein
MMGLANERLMKWRECVEMKVSDGSKHIDAPDEAYVSAREKAPFLHSADGKYRMRQTSGLNESTMLLLTLYSGTSRIKFFLYRMVWLEQMVSRGSVGGGRPCSGLFYFRESGEGR